MWTMSFADLSQTISEKKKPVDLNLLEKACRFAAFSHGEDTYEHSIRLARILLDFDVYDSKTLATAILHDVLDEGAATAKDVENEFGGEIAQLVTLVSRLKVVKFGFSEKEAFAENLRKMFLSMAQDLRVVFVKLVDIFDNLKNSQNLIRGEKITLAKETLEIFAPLAARLGIGELKGQLEDLAFPLAYPKEYDWVQKYSKKEFVELDKMLLRVKGKLYLELSQQGLPVEIHGRKKHIFSLYKKLLRPEISKDLSKIYDLVALRIVVDTVEDCYTVLGLVHKLWRPLPNYVRDYIATPKPNGYRSLHTTVFGPAGRPFEIQIRTWEMHQEAEFGIAAHWHYAEEKQRSGRQDTDVEMGFLAPEEKLKWVRELALWQEDIATESEFLKALKIDVFADRVFCFTPKGDVKDLPVGATPIDFAYAVHTKIGDRAQGAKINGKLVSLDYQLKTGDVVEILTSKDETRLPSKDWLNFVITTVAKREIKKHF